jgi:hypothetical protein
MRRSRLHDRMEILQTPPLGDQDPVGTVQEDGVDGEEVAGENARGPLEQKGSPGGARPPWSRRQTRSEQHLAYRGRGDVDAGFLEFAGDASVSPCGISRARLGSRYRAHPRATSKRGPPRQSNEIRLNPFAAKH